MKTRFWATFTLLFFIGLSLALLASRGFNVPGIDSLIPAFTQPGEEMPPHPVTLPTPPGVADRSNHRVLDHTANDSEVCNRPATRSRFETDSTLIYRWTDEDGQTHLSDERPEDTITQVIDISGTRRDFTYRIEREGIDLPVGFSGQIAAGSKRIYDTWHFFLGEGNLRQAIITLRLIESTEFDALWSERWPGAKPVGGFYSISNNTAYVRYNPSMPARATATSFHEISHLITASHLGVTPPWLTEGLAEYAETMVVTDQTAAIRPNQDHLRLLQSTNLPSLPDFLAMDRTKWNGNERDLNYAVAWSLIHHLMGTDIGRTALKELISQANANACKPFSASEALASAYPGGLPRLESDWRTGIRNGTYGIHQT